MRRFALFLGVVLLHPCLASAAVPSVPRQISLQGKATDAGGIPVSDGMHSASFALYTVSAGGSSIWTEGPLNVTTAGGLYAHNLGSVTSLPTTLEDRDSLWLQVTFDGNVLSPRIRLVSAPSANVADALEVRSPNGEFAAIRTDRANSDIVIAHPLSGTDIAYLGGEGTGHARLRFDGPTPAHQLRLQVEDENGAGPSLFLKSTGGFQGVFLGGGSGGGQLQMIRADGVNGFLLTDNANGSTLIMSDVAGFERFRVRTDLTGDNSIVVPDGSISSLETLDEPGIASINSASNFQLTGGAEVVLQRSITAPSAGFVLVIGTCRANYSHSSGTASQGNFGVSNTTSFTGINSFIHFRSGSLPSGISGDIVTAHCIFSVSAGEHTFSLVAQEVSGDYSVNERQLSLVFLRSEYGTFDPPVAVDDDGGRDTAPARASEVPVRSAGGTEFRSEIEMLRQEVAELRSMLMERDSDAEPE